MANLMTSFTKLYLSRDILYGTFIYISYHKTEIMEGIDFSLMKLGQ